jgi:putative transposase
MEKPQSYTPEFKAEAVKLVLVQGLSLREAAGRLSIPKGTLTNWVADAKGGAAAAAPGARTVPELEAEMAKLRRDLAEARMERDILKKAMAYFARGVAARCALMRQWRLEFPVQAMARVLGVSRSGFYAWLDRPPSPRALEDGRLKVAIAAAHEKTRQTYGATRLQAELKAGGFAAGRDRIARLRRDLGIRCRQRRKFKATTHSNHEFPVADNVLGQAFEARGPDEVWHVDITYVQTGEGWLYLAGVKDQFTGEIVGYAMGERMTQGLTPGRCRWPSATASPRPAWSTTRTGGANTAPWSTASGWSSMGW